MKPQIRNRLWCAFAVSVFFLVMAGCTRDQNTQSPTAKGKDDDKHGHASTGPHAGALAEWGKDEFHAEFTLDHSAKQVTVYILDGKAKKAPPIDPDKVTNVTLSAKNTADSIFVELKHDPQKSGAGGIAYVAGHEQFAKAGDYAGTISGKINGAPYSGTFTAKGHDEMPSAVGSKKERDLYLTPGGLYSKKDIQANGNTVPSVKFKDKSWAHDDNLKVGDKTCPVTKNKAETECAWIVNDSRYEFCCPPCLDKFVGWAKTQPDKVKAPTEYVYRGNQ